MHPRFRDGLERLSRGNSRLGSMSDLAANGGPPHDGEMEDRILKLEAIIPTLATKADVEKGFHDLVKWVVGTALVGIGLALTIMTFVLNNAVPKQPPAPAPAPQFIQAPAPQPIVIQLPPDSSGPTTTSPPPAAR